jgi:lysophospholipase L1-like esterase
MLTRWFKYNFLTLLLLLSTSGYFGVQIYKDQMAPDEKVEYFLKNTKIFQQRQLKDLPETAILFYGDSLVQGLAVNRVNSSLTNFGIGHDHSSNLLSRIREDLRQQQFSKYAVAIGINDIGRGVAVGDLYNNILEILELLSFADTIYLHTSLPVAESRDTALTINRKVRKINFLLSELPKIHKNVVIIDTYKSLAVDGFLPENFHIGDGLHLNSAANRKWLKLLGTTENDQK